MTKIITVILFRDKTHEVHESEVGFMTKITDEVEAVYHATSMRDADFAVQAHEEGPAA